MWSRWSAACFASLVVRLDCLAPLGFHQLFPPQQYVAGGAADPPEAVVDSLGHGFILPIDSVSSQASGSFISGSVDGGLDGIEADGCETAIVRLHPVALYFNYRM
jgi:hypothetical protein